MAKRKIDPHTLQQTTSSARQPREATRDTTQALTDEPRAWKLPKTTKIKIQTTEQEQK